MFSRSARAVDALNRTPRQEDRLGRPRSSPNLRSESTPKVRPQTPTRRFVSGRSEARSPQNTRLRTPSTVQNYKLKRVDKENVQENNIQPQPDVVPDKDVSEARREAFLVQQKRQEELEAKMAASRAAKAACQNRRASAGSVALQHHAELQEAELSHPTRMTELHEVTASLRHHLQLTSENELTESALLEQLERGILAKEQEVQQRREQLEALEERQRGHNLANRAVLQQIHAVQQSKREAQAATASQEDLARNVVFMRQLHNEYLSLKGNIRVFCRIRPFSGHGDDRELRLEVAEDAASVVVHSGPLRNVTGSTTHSNSWSFAFDHIFRPQASQADVFEEVALLVQSALDGYKVAIFAYGQTGSGKTHTMEGRDEDRGMIPRTVDLIFQEVREMQRSGWNFEVRVSALEVYQEQVRDLLKPGRPASPGTRMKKESSGAEPERTRVMTGDAAAVHSLLKRCAKERRTAATEANDRSSRSHAVFQLHLCGRCTVGEQSRAVEGLLSFVDLAGSERIEKTHAEGDRLKEAQFINKSLSALGDVVEALARRSQAKSSAAAVHVPYRNSKLTTLLRDSLGGDSKTLMVVNVSSVQSNLGETLSSLRFASKVHGCSIGVATRQVIESGPPVNRCAGASGTAQTFQTSEQHL